MSSPWGASGGYGGNQQQQSSGYGAPNQPQQGGYGAPPPPQGGYGAPPPIGGYGALSGYGGAPGYGSPQPGGYGAPSGYGSPGGSGYGAPGAGYRPTGGYGASTPPPAPPPGGYGAPSGGYGAPPPSGGGYGAPPPAAGYGAHSSGYGAPTPPSAGYGGAPSGGYGAPSGYGAPQNNNHHHQHHHHHQQQHHRQHEGGHREDQRQTNERFSRGDRYDRPRREEIGPTATMWVGGLDVEITEGDLRDAVCRYGNPERVTRLAERGMAFVHFATEEECTLVMQSMKGSTIKGHSIKLNYGKPIERAERDDRPPRQEDRPQRTFRENPATNVLWLGGLTADHTESQLSSVFSSLEGLQDVNVHQDKGCAFVQFRDVAQTIAAKEFLAQSLNNEILGTTVKVNFGKHMQNSVPPRRSGGGGDGPSVMPSQPARELVPASLPAPTMPSSSFSSAGPGVDPLAPPMSAGGDTTQYGNRTHQNAFGASVQYYADCSERGAMSKHEVDRLVGYVDDVRRDSGREELREQLMNRSGNALQCLRVITSRLNHFFVRDPHKKLLVMYGVIEFVLMATSPFVLVQSFGSDLEAFFSTVAFGQCERGLHYVSDMVRIIKDYCEPHVASALAKFIVQQQYRNEKRGRSEDRNEAPRVDDLDD
eukprot:PhM_4_TR6330/c0_g1_i1/m.52494